MNEELKKDIKYYLKHRTKRGTITQADLQKKYNISNYTLKKYINRVLLEMAGGA
jgi:spore maturation protein CgeB